MNGRIWKKRPFFHCFVKLRTQQYHVGIKRNEGQLKGYEGRAEDTKDTGGCYKS